MAIRNTGSGLVSACEQWLMLRGHYVLRLNSGTAYRVGRNGKQYRIRLAPEGSTDLISCVSGRMICIECKTGSGRQSPAQQAAQHLIERAGGVYLLVRSCQELEAAIVPLEG